MPVSQDVMFMFLHHLKGGTLITYKVLLDWVHSLCCTKTSPCHFKNFHTKKKGTLLKKHVKVWQFIRKFSIYDQEQGGDVKMPEGSQRDKHVVDEHGFGGVILQKECAKTILACLSMPALSLI